MKYKIMRSKSVHVVLHGISQWNCHAVFLTFESLSVCIFEVWYLFFQWFDFLVKLHNLSRYKRTEQATFTILTPFDKSVLISDQNWAGHLHKLAILVSLESSACVFSFIWFLMSSSSFSKSSGKTEWIFYFLKIYEKVYRINVTCICFSPPLIFSNSACVWRCSCFFSLAISSCWAKIWNTDERKVGLDQFNEYKTMTSDDGTITFYCHSDDHSLSLVFSLFSSWIPSIK